jgi:threonine dehydratase
MSDQHQDDDKHQRLTVPTLADIHEAAVNIRGKAIRTPLIRLNWQGGDDDVHIYLKLESLQPISSFKVRPAANAIACIKDKNSLRRSGVCTASAGNFAQGLAWCCFEEGIPCTVVAPDHAPETKLAEIRRRGATVIKVPFSEWWEIIESHTCPQAPAGAHFIHPGAENSVLAGNATIALEIVEDLPDVDCIVVPYGSGAVCTGVASGVQALGLSHRCKVLAAEPATAAPFALSKKRGCASKFTDWEASFVDGCGGQAVLGEVWALAEGLVAGGCAVDLPDIAEAIKVLAERNRVVAEGAGACGVAAAMGGMCGDKARRIVCVVTGAGIDTRSLVHILQGRGVPPVITQAQAEKEKDQEYTNDKVERRKCTNEYECSDDNCYKYKGLAGVAVLAMGFGLGWLAATRQIQQRG